MGPTLVVDTGDFLGTPDKPYGYDTDLMLDIMKTIRYDAVTLGEAELRRGLAVVKESAARGGLTIVAANMFRVGEDRVRPFAPYVVKKIGRTRFAVIGIIGKEDRGANALQNVWLDPKMLEQEGISVTDPLVALREIVPQVRRRADVVVVLAHTGLERAREIATLVPGVDVVLAGHGPQILEEAERPAALLAKCGQRSDRLGSLQVVTEGGQVTSSSGRAVTLHQDRSPFDAAIRTLVYDALSLDSFGNKKSVTTVKVSGDSIAVTPPAAPAAAAGEETSSRLAMKGDHFLGDSSCKDCHISQWAQWSTTAHATAYERLAGGDDWNNHECLPCHVTGYAAAGGHSTTALSPDLWNVQCEECHGMGSRHAMSGTEVGESTCLKCHTKDQDPDFDFARDVVKVFH
jgi:hypothetical protein